MTNNTKKSAIIFLNPPYGIESDQLRQNIIKFFRANKLSAIKAIQARGIYDTSALHKLMHKIRNWKKTYYCDN